MLTVLAFVLALGLLVAVHEYGHYRMARACGVRVLRFSVGFGKTLLTWKPKGSETEFSLGLLPLGGYIKMLDQREAPVAPEDMAFAFNTQPLLSRAAIVAAGPSANLVLALALYAMVNWIGVDQPKAILAAPVPASIAQKAGLMGGEYVHSAAFDSTAQSEVASFEELRWFLARGALDRRDVNLMVSDRPAGVQREIRLKLADIGDVDLEGQLFQIIGLTGPLTKPLIGQVIAGGAAQRSGLMEGDLVLAVGAQKILDGQQLREVIRHSADNARANGARWKIERNKILLEIDVTPEPQLEGTKWVGKIGAYVGAPSEMSTVRYGFWRGLELASVRTWEVSWLTVKMMGKMLIGEVSLKNLSGPITIADYAGKSASLGLTQYLIFLALISVSLGVLNLLPLPVLDGGHLMYYLWEAVTGKSVSEVWADRLQRGGLGLLMMMMSIALFNDLTRIVG